jgi:hypothetical protein
VNEIEVGLVYDKDQINSEDHIDDGRGFNFVEKKKVFMHQNDDHTDNGDQILEGQAGDRRPGDKIDHQGIDLGSAVGDDPEGEEGIENAKQDYGQNKYKITRLIPIHVVVFVFFCTAGFSSFSDDGVPAEGFGGPLSSVRNRAFVSSILLGERCFDFTHFPDNFTRSAKSRAITPDDDLGGDIYLWYMIFPPAMVTSTLADMILS